MKKCTLLALFLLLNYFIYAQVQNGDFEQWEMQDTSDILSDWTVYSELEKTYHKSPESYSGNWALYVNPLPPYANHDWCGQTWIQQYLDISNYQEPINLKFHSITKSLYGDSLGYIGTVVCYVGAQVCQYYEFLDTSSTYKERQVLLDKKLSDSVLITIKLGSIMGFNDGCYYQSEVWLDGLYIDALTSVASDEVDKLQFYPNPFMSDVRCEHCPVHSEYQIYNTKGQVIQEGRIQPNQQISLEESGIFYLKFKESNKIYKLVSM